MLQRDVEGGCHAEIKELGLEFGINLLDCAVFFGTFDAKSFACGLEFVL